MPEMGCAQIESNNQKGDLYNYDLHFGDTFSLTVRHFMTQITGRTAVVHEQKPQDELCMYIKVYRKVLGHLLVRDIRSCSPLKL